MSDSCQPAIRNIYYNDGTTDRYQPRFPTQEPAMKPQLTLDLLSGPRRMPKMYTARAEITPMRDLSLSPRMSRGAGATINYKTGNVTSEYASFSRSARSKKAFLKK